MPGAHLLRDLFLSFSPKSPRRRSMPPEKSWICHCFEGIGRSRCPTPQWDPILSFLHVFVKMCLSTFEIFSYISAGSRISCGGGGGHVRGCGPPTWVLFSENVKTKELGSTGGLHRKFFYVDPHTGAASVDVHPNRNTNNG